MWLSPGHVELWLHFIWATPVQRQRYLDPHPGLHEAYEVFVLRLFIISLEPNRRSWRQPHIYHNRQRPNGSDSKRPGRPVLEWAELLNELPYDLIYSENRNKPTGPLQQYIRALGASRYGTRDLTSKQAVEDAVELESQWPRRHDVGAIEFKSLLQTNGFRMPV